MSTPLRLFFAIELDDAIRSHLTQLIDELRQQSWEKYIHWTHAENLHITLRFIGVCQPAQITDLIAQARIAVKPLQQFTINLTNIRLFPTKANPLVLAIGIHPVPALFQLANAIEQATVAAGFAAERRAYLPHLTIGRLDKQQARHLQPQLPAFNANININKIALLNSEVIANKRFYKPLQHFHLL